MAGFRNFLMRGNIVDLAVAVVVGVAFNSLVHAFVGDLITPLIAAVGKQPDFSGLTFTLNHSTFYYGKFLNEAVSFTIVAGVVYYLVVLPANRLASLASKQPPPSPTRTCPECLSDIPPAASRCRYCTAVVTPAPEPAAPPSPSLVERLPSPIAERLRPILPPRNS